MNVLLLPRRTVAKAPSIFLAPSPSLQFKKIDRAIDSLYYNCVLMPSQSQLSLWTPGAFPQSSPLPTQKCFLLGNCTEHLTFLILCSNSVHNLGLCVKDCLFSSFLICVLLILLTTFIREKSKQDYLFVFFIILISLGTYENSTN